jgi:EAL domain-containing protein (putative c-di-GMP-specific phosphodiesterase class I)/GGDEF domain-containing protein
MNAAAAMERLRHGVVGAFPPGIAAMDEHAHLELFHRIFDAQSLSAVFQPIIDFRVRGYLGYEGLIRGPAGTPLHSPLALFALARSAGLSAEFERLCREIVLREFAALKLQGRLFINVSVSCLTDPHFMNGQTARLLDDLGLPPQRIVIELTENQQVSDFSALRDVLHSYRKLGYQIAMDDLGEGFSNLRMWSEVQPEFVKIDRHFINNIDDDVLKFQLVRAMREIAETTRSHLIAEGIETGAEFTTVRDLGIGFGQGFLIARPDSRPQKVPPASIIHLLERGKVVAFPHALASGNPDNTAQRVMRYVTPVLPEEDNDHIYARFESDAELTVLPVVGEDGVPLGLINRHSLIDRFARPYRRELYGKKPCTLLMNAQPIVVDHQMTVQEIGLMLGQSAHHNLLDGFVVTREGGYAGVGSTQALMATITDLQIRAARYSNPLTQLPGNVPINEHIDRLLQNDIAFTAAYCDIDHFKPYNDAYGYRRGDQLIQMLGVLLSETCDPKLDFVGHIGGDDFMVLVQSANWRERLEESLSRFSDTLASFVDDEHALLGGYHAEDRRGDEVFHPLPSLSIGCLLVEPRHFHNHYDVATAVTDAKRQAKKIPGNSLFVERRRIAGEPEKD